MNVVTFGFQGKRGPATRCEVLRDPAAAPLIKITVGCELHAFRRADDLGGIFGVLNSVQCSSGLARVIASELLFILCPSPPELRFN